MGKLAAQHGESGSKEKRIGWVEVLGFYLWKLIALIVESNHIKRIIGCTNMISNHLCVYSYLGVIIFY